jgi:hypothetical protein
MHEQNEVKKEAEKDYVFRKKVIYKGKMAKPGFVYLVVDVKKMKQVFTLALMIHGKHPDQEKILTEMRQAIKTKYGV